LLRPEKTKKKTYKKKDEFLFLKQGDIEMNSVNLTQILRDYKKVNEEILDLIMHGSNGLRRQNLIIIKPDYIHPTIVSERVALSHPDGEFQYFQSLRNVLEKALSEEKLTRNELPHKAPPYLRDLVQE